MEFIVILSRVLFSAFSNVFQKKLANQGLHPFTIVMVSYFVLSLISLPLLFTFDSSQLPTTFWLNSFLAALLDMAGTLYLVMSLSKTDLSVFGPLNAYKVVISMLLAILFLGEIPSLQGLSGVITIIIGSYFLFPTTAQLSNSLLVLIKQRGVQYRFLSIFLFSIGTVPLKSAVLSGGAIATTVYWCLMGFPLAILAHQYLIDNKFKTEIQQAFNYVHQFISLGILLFLMQLMTLFVLSHLFIAYSLALFQLSMVLQVFLGYRLFNEPHVMRRLCASGIMIVGSLLVIKA